MPFINVIINKKLDENQKDSLQRAIAENITLIPTKLPEHTTVGIRDNCYNLYRNMEPVTAAFVDVRLFKASPFEGKQAYAQKLFEIFDSIAGIPKNMLQINYVELQEWGSNGDLMR